MGGFAFPFLIGKLLDDHGERAFSLRLRWTGTDPSIVSMLGFATMCRVWAGMTAFVFLLAIKFTSPRVPLRKPIGIRPKWFAIDFKTVNHPIVWTMVSSASLFDVEIDHFFPFAKTRTHAESSCYSQSLPSSRQWPTFPSRST